jgi:LmbE family N-acetylglucosaminyl deacetylase
MKILVLAPHPDDESIGCGGTLCLHSRKGDRIAAVFMTSGELGLKDLPREKAWKIREAEAKKAAVVLGIASLDFLRLPDWTSGDHIRAGARVLRSILIRERPDIIYLPHPDEWHPDHQSAGRLLKAAWPGRGIKRPVMRGYEIWTPLSRFDHVENISSLMSRKLRAVRAHKSQLTEFDYTRAIEGLNSYRGVLAGRCRYAEVFMNYDR